MPFVGVTLILRVVMELGLVAALAFWGVHSGGTAAAKIALGVGAPVLAFAVWGAVDFHRAGRLAELLRLLEELFLTALAAIALYSAGEHDLGIGLAALSVVYHALVYVSGQRLLAGAGSSVR